MKPTEFDDLVARLNRPPMMRIADWGEFVCPHHIHDADWPSPANFASAAQMLRRLPHFLRVVCAATAADLAVQEWDAAQPFSDDGDLAPPPRERMAMTPALALVWQWLSDSHDVPTDDVLRARSGVMRRCAPESPRYYDNDPPRTPLHEVAAAIECTLDTIGGSPKATSAAACYVAVVTTLVPGVSAAAAWDSWWRRSVCRMACGRISRFAERAVAAGAKE